MEINNNDFAENSSIFFLHTAYYYTYYFFVIKIWQFYYHLEHKIHQIMYNSIFFMFG
jgi:hypothetical protein